MFQIAFVSPMSTSDLFQEKHIFWSSFKGLSFELIITYLMRYTFSLLKIRGK